ncbi:MAG: hypothetical protein WC533_01310 [Candidatus Pacearchaeota archaeon]
MIIAIGNKLETITARAILEQNTELKDALEGIRWRQDKKVYTLKLDEYVQLGDFYLCGPLRNSPKGFIDNPLRDLTWEKSHQGQLYIGDNLICVHSAGSAISSTDGQLLCADGRTELVLPIYGGNEEVKRQLVGSVIDLFDKRFSVQFNGKPLYEKYIVYGSSVEKQLVEDILNGRNRGNP